MDKKIEKGKGKQEDILLCCREVRCSFEVGCSGPLRFCWWAVGIWVVNFLRLQYIEVFHSRKLFFLREQGPFRSALQNSFTDGAETCEVKRSGFIWLLVHFYFDLQNDFTLQYLICAKQVEPKPNGFSL